MVLRPILHAYLFTFARIAASQYSLNVANNGREIQCYVFRVETSMIRFIVVE